MASGQSLTEDDARYAREHAPRVIVINRTWERCPSADVLYAADCAWWLYSGEAPAADAFKGERWTTAKAWNSLSEKRALEAYNVVQTQPGRSFSVLPPLFTGSNSPFQALGLAAWWGARKIVFLGLDLHGTTWHTPHRHKRSGPATLAGFRVAYKSAAPMIKAAGVEIINASPGTILDCFPKCSIRDALK